MRRVIEALATVVAFSAGPLAAQLPEPAAGTRVRIHTAGATRPLTGIVAWQDGARVAVLRTPADTAIIPLTAIDRLDVSQGRRSNALRGARTGALVGAGVGLALGIAALAEEEDSFFDYGAEVVPLSAVGVGFVGGTIGLLVGALSSSEQWTPAGMVITVRPAPEGVSLGAILEF